MDPALEMELQVQELEGEYGSGKMMNVTPQSESLVGNNQTK